MKVLAIALSRGTRGMWTPYALLGLLLFGARPAAADGLFISDRSTGEISEYDLADVAGCGTVLDPNVCGVAGAMGLELDQNGDLYFAIGQDVQVCSGGGPPITFATFPPSDTPYDLEFDAGGTLWVVGKSNVSSFAADGTPGLSFQHNLPGLLVEKPLCINVHPVTREVFVGFGNGTNPTYSPGLNRYDPDTGVLLQQFVAGQFGAGGVAFSPDGAFMYVSNVQNGLDPIQIYDATSFALLDTFNPSHGGNGIGLAVEPTSGDLYVLNTGSSQCGVDVYTTNPTAPYLVFQDSLGDYGRGMALGAGAPPGSEAPCDVIVADLTGDGPLDIATANSGSDDVGIRVNDGSGEFAMEFTVPLQPGDKPTSLAAGDLVAGGGTDVAVAVRGEDPSDTSRDLVRILSNDPLGAFTEVTTIPLSSVGLNPVAIAAGDLNGAGRDDLAVAMEGELLFPSSGGLAVILDGGAAASLQPPPGGFRAVRRVDLCDLDGDGDNDVIATMAGTQFGPPTTSDNALLYENDGAGAFPSPPVTLSVAQNPNGICYGDLDADGDLDLAVTAETAPLVFPGGVHVFLNDGLTAGSWNAGAFSSTCGPFQDGLAPIDLACADLDGDSIPGFVPLMDLVVVNFGSEDVTNFLGFDAPTCSFAATERHTVGDVPVAVALGELNNDGCGVDVVVANKASDDVTVFLSDGSGLAQATTFGTGCPGTGGLTPMIEAVGLPQLGTTFGVKVTNALPNAPALLGASLSQLTLPLGPSCELYLAPPLSLASTFTDSAGEAEVKVSVPAGASALLGCDVYFQYVIFDPGGAYAGLFALSDALRIKIGS